MAVNGYLIWPQVKLDLLKQPQLSRLQKNRTLTPIKVFKLTKEAERIYSLNFDSKYDCAMTFLRYQEFYESDNPRFQNQKFTISSYIDWYVKTKGSFSYYTDWVGFNFPIEIIDKVHNLGIDDLNHYDMLMKGISEMIKSNANSNECYLIGYSGNKDKSAFDHEMAHGLYYVNKEYYTDINNEINNFYIKNDGGEYFLKIKETIIKNGYAESSVIDEIQAYVVSGTPDYFWPGRKPKIIKELISNLNKIHAKYK